MILVDQPVELQESFLVLVEIRRCEGSRVETVFIIQDCPDGIDIGLCNTGKGLN